MVKRWFVSPIIPVIQSGVPAIEVVSASDYDAAQARICELEAALELISAQSYEGDPHVGYCHPEGCSSPGIARDALTAASQADRETKHGG